MTKPAALVLASRLPYPLDDGWKMRTFHVLKAVAEQFDTTLLVYHAGPEPLVHSLAEAVGGRLGVRVVPPPRRNSPTKLLAGLITSTSLYEWNVRACAYRNTVHTLLQATDFALGVAVCTFMAPFFAYARRPRAVVIDTHNLDSDLMAQYARRLPSLTRRLYAARMVPQVVKLERREFGRADQVWVCSEAELAGVLERAPCGSPRCVPNGVDTASFPANEGLHEHGRMLFFGRLDYAPNVDAVEYLADELWPRIRALRPGLSLRVVGRDPVPAVVRACERAEAMELIGEVPDVRVELSSADAVLVPLRMGGGTRLKILEAMAAGRPIISTPIGAEGIAAVDGRHILIAATTADFVRMVAKVLNDGSFAKSLGREARSLAELQYDWQAIRRSAQRLLAPYAV